MFKHVAFLVRTLVRKCKKAQKNEKSITLHVKNCKIDAFLVRILMWKRKNDPGTSGHQDFRKFSILRYVGVFCVGFLSIGVYFLSFSFIFFRSIVVYLKLGSQLTFLLTFLLTSLLTFWLTFWLTSLLTFLLTFWLTFLLTFLLTFWLTFWLTRRREEEGVDFFLKSNNPTPTGGE